MTHFGLLPARRGERAGHGLAREEAAQDLDDRPALARQLPPREPQHPIAGELEVRFEYRSDPDKGSAQEGTWREHRNAQSVQTILRVLEGLPEAKDYLRLLKIPGMTVAGHSAPAAPG